MYKYLYHLLRDLNEKALLGNKIINIQSNSNKILTNTLKNVCL